MKMKRAVEVAEALRTAFKEVWIDGSRSECVVRAKAHNRWPLKQRKTVTYVGPGLKPRK